MKTRLIFPPFWIYNAPYLSVPSLVAYLEEKGHSVDQVDLNLEFYDKMMSHEFMSECMRRIKLENSEQSTSSIAQYMNQLGNFAINHIEEYKNTFRSTKALDFSVYEDCRNFLALGLAIINAAFKDEKLVTSYYESSYDRSSFKCILEAAHDAYSNKKETLVSVLLSYFIDDIVKEVDLIGISLTGLDQIIPSFILAGKIKQKNPNIKILLGGSVPTRWFSNVANAPDIFDFFDYVVINEGEVPLDNLLTYLKGNCSIYDVPQLFFKDENGCITYNDLPITNLQMCSLPKPVFKKTDLPRYFSPIPILPLLGSRGCYWGKCTFCDHSFVYHNSFRPSLANKTVECIEYYFNEYGVNHINFHDEAMTPRAILELSELLLQKELDIKWTTDARLDKGLSYDILKKAKQAGLKVLMFGLESINKRVISIMKKGTNPDDIKQILYDTKELGIWTHLFFICGFPTETLQEYQETVNFIKSNKEIIATHGCSEFGLNKYSPVVYEPLKYSIEILDKNNCDNASMDFAFKRLNVDENYVDEMRKARDEVIKKLRTYVQKEANVIYRENWVIFWGYVLNL